MSKFSYLIIGVLLVCCVMLVSACDNAHGQVSEMSNSSTTKSYSNFKMVGVAPVGSNIMEFPDGRYRIFTTGSNSIFVIKVE